MQVKLDAGDFNQLWDASMEWGESWKLQGDRFDNGISFHWKHAYWFELHYANLVLAREYLTSIGAPFEITNDEAGGWVILTDYDHAFGMVI